MNVQKIYAIVGYTYRGENYCPSCMETIAMERLAQLGTARPLPPYHSPEAWLNRWADRIGIDRENESTFDSDVFPKVVFGSMVQDDERCGKCGEELS